MKRNNGWIIHPGLPAQPINPAPVLFLIIDGFPSLTVDLLLANLPEPNPAWVSGACRRVEQARKWCESLGS